MLKLFIVTKMKEVFIDSTTSFVQRQWDRVRILLTNTKAIHQIGAGERSEKNLKLSTKTTGFSGAIRVALI